MMLHSKKASLDLKLEPRRKHQRYVGEMMHVTNSVMVKPPRQIYIMFFCFAYFQGCFFLRGWEGKFVYDLMGVEILLMSCMDNISLSFTFLTDKKNILRSQVPQ